MNGILKKDLVKLVYTSYQGVVKLKEIIEEQESRKAYNYEIIYDTNLKNFKERYVFI